MGARITSTIRKSSFGIHQCGKWWNEIPSFSFILKYFPKTLEINFKWV